MEERSTGGGVEKERSTGDGVEKEVREDFIIFVLVGSRCFADMRQSIKCLQLKEEYQ